jgi:hypothetical protein
MNGRSSAMIAAVCVALSAGVTGACAADDWQKDFPIAACALKTSGTNPYFVLQPGHQLQLEGGGQKLLITVLDETKVIDGVTTRVVEEREWKKGELHEVARNYFAFCEQTKDVFYFGEEVEFYENGKVVRRDGSWLAGVDGNKAGLMMPGSPKPKMRYYQELAPKAAMDRAEIISISETCKTPAGTFTGCMKVLEGSALEPLAREYKYHAPGIGLVADGDMKLVRHGFLKK